MLYPIDFNFFGTYIEKIKQIGNAIAPPFVKHITSYIKDILNGTPESKQLIKQLFDEVKDEQDQRDAADQETD